MDLKQLQYFVVSVESGSFKKAAEMLYTTQPHISKSIKKSGNRTERAASGTKSTWCGSDRVR
mgnify:CR=1 FL=1